MAGSVFGPAAEGEGEVAALPRNFWTPEEDNRLRMLIVAGKPIEFVAAELKRSAKAVMVVLTYFEYRSHTKLKSKAKGE